MYIAFDIDGDYEEETVNYIDSADTMDLINDFIFTLFPTRVVDKVDDSDPTAVTIFWKNVYPTARVKILNVELNKFCVRSIS